MSPRTLPVSAPLAFFLFFSTFVVAQVDVTAVCTLSSLAWTFNSLGQSPCLVAAYMFSTCFGGSYDLGPLEDASAPAYDGPDETDSNKCQCSTVGYSLISACVQCQQNYRITWSYYVSACITILPPSQFPNPVPAGIRVPYWAVLDVTSENNWDASKAYAAGDSPEYGPGAIINGTAVPTSSASASSSYTGTSTPTPRGNTSNAGAIAGGVVGGVATISIVIIIVVILFLRRRRPQAASASVGASQPMQIAQSPSGSPLTKKFYDPDDPSTYPGSQERPQSLDMSSASQVPLSSHIGSGSTVADMQISHPYARGYHGLPQPA